MVAHSAGRLREALRERVRRASSTPNGSADGTARAAGAEDFLSGTSGTVGGLDARAARSSRRS